MLIGINLSDSVTGIVFSREELVVDEEKNTIDYYDEPEGTEEEPRRTVIPEEEIPPPPQDWMSSPITKTILWLILLGIVAVLIWKAPGWIEYMKAHPYGTSIGIFLLAVFAIIMLFAYWRYRAKGWIGQSNWDTRRKRRPE
jgi:hypothetical protein